MSLLVSLSYGGRNEAVQKVIGYCGHLECERETVVDGDTGVAVWCNHVPRFRKEWQEYEYEDRNPRSRGQFLG